MMLAVVVQRGDNAKVMKVVAGVNCRRYWKFSRSLWAGIEGLRESGRRPQVRHLQVVSDKTAPTTQLLFLLVGLTQYQRSPPV